MLGAAEWQRARESCVFSERVRTCHDKQRKKFHLPAGPSGHKNRVDWFPNFVVQQGKWVLFLFFTSPGAPQNLETSPPDFVARATGGAYYNTVRHLVTRSNSSLLFFALV